jgi:23S rRNA pseudouridine955/2504/2580 synthase
VGRGKPPRDFEGGGHSSFAARPPRASGPPKAQFSGRADRNSDARGKGPGGRAGRGKPPRDFEGGGHSSFAARPARASGPPKAQLSGRADRNPDARGKGPGGRAGRGKPPRDFEGGGHSSFAARPPRASGPPKAQFSGQADRNPDTRGKGPGGWAGRGKPPRDFEAGGQSSFEGRPARASGPPKAQFSGRADRNPDARGKGPGGRTGRGKPPRDFEDSARPSFKARHARPPVLPKAQSADWAVPDDDPDMTPAALPIPTTVQTVTISLDESGMRVDRFLETRYPGLSFSHIQRVIRKGELRVNGKRVDGKDRLQAGQAVRIPPLKLDAPKPAGALNAEEEKTRAFLKSITLHEDDDVMVLNKPMGLSVQGGSGTTRHLDGMLAVLRQPGPDGQRPRLVHRLDKDTAGCLLVAKTRFAAAALAKTFRSRSARKIYWALVAGVPKPKQGRISTYLAKEEREDESVMRIAKHGDEGASHAVTFYAVVETAAQQLSWLSLKPVTGRTHQLRAHMAHIGHPIVGDPKYFNIENWGLPGGLQNKLHLFARRIAVPHPRGGVLDITASLPPHMLQSWNLLGFDTKRYDPIEDAPEE